MTTTALQNLLSIEFGKRQYREDELHALLSVYKMNKGDINSLEHVEAKAFPNIYYMALSISKNLPEDKSYESMKGFIMNHEKTVGFWRNNENADADVVLLTKEN